MMHGPAKIGDLMQLADIETEPSRTRRYLERYVNDGSPSGFTYKYTCSEGTSPFALTPSFALFAGSVRSDQIEDHGAIPPWLRPDELLLHPDMACEPLVVRNCPTIRESIHRVTPTASMRTVEVLDAVHPCFAKLSYNRLLGRVNRQISRAHALSALEITRILDDAAGAGALPPLFGYLREGGARIASLDAPDGPPYEWGTIFRDVDPHPRRTSGLLVPTFALFATDRQRPEDPKLVTQLVARHGIPEEEYLFDNILAPIVSCYFEMLLRYALQFECNAQNILLGFDGSGRATEVVFRDFESVDKDISLAETLDLDVTFTVSPFKCVHRGLYNYEIKHSFMYDFKLGEYVLSPIIATASSTRSRNRLAERTRKLAAEYIQRLPSGFFPTDGQWYSYANVVVDKNKKRPYVAHPNPRYR
jgi:hypothetical protein